VGFPVVGFPALAPLPFSFGTVFLARLTALSAVGFLVADVPDKFNTLHGKQKHGCAWCSFSAFN
jgi:hypothetical protein